MTYNTIGSSVYLLLLFEPCSIAFETLQVLKKYQLFCLVLLLVILFLAMVNKI